LAILGEQKRPARIHNRTDRSARHRRVASGPDGHRRAVGEIDMHEAFRTKFLDQLDLPFEQQAPVRSRLTSRQEREMLRPHAKLDFAGQTRHGKWQHRFAFTAHTGDAQTL
jgi:hypothetical protein